MGTRSITIELDDETIRCLAVLGSPIDVLAHLADAAADGVRHPVHPRREHTDESLRVERDKSDANFDDVHEALEGEADEVVRLARERADQVVEAAREEVERARSPGSTTVEAGARCARALLEHERSDADAVLEQERAEQKRLRARSLVVERGATDKDLGGERAYADTVLVDQREANERMVEATIRAQELAEEAEAARQRAEASERELRAAAEFREMFIGILGHDLRNPLGAIVMAAALLLRRGNLDGQDAETAARIIRSSQRMTRMISQVLDLTRARFGGGLTLDAKPTDLREICRDVVEEFEATVELEVAGDVTGTWDDDRLGEALSNLVGNAIEHAAEGTAVVVKAHPDGAEVVVEITNRGDPIPPDVLPFIFEPFRRGRQQEKSAAGNLGLGLYIANQVVLSHGGKLEARSADGTTTFVMRLPRGSAPGLMSPA